MAESIKGHFKKYSNKDIITEVKHIKNKDPSSYNWTPAARKELMSELERRKKEGSVRSDAGTKKSAGSIFNSNDDLGFGKPFKMKKFF